MGYDLYTRPTIQIPDQCPRKQDDIHLSGFQMVRLSGIKIIFKNRTIWHPTTFQPFEYQTSSVFRSPTVFQWGSKYQTPYHIKVRSSKK